MRRSGCAADIAVRSSAVPPPGIRSEAVEEGEEVGRSPRSWGWRRKFGGFVWSRRRGRTAASRRVKTVAVIIGLNKKDLQMEKKKELEPHVSATGFPFCRLNAQRWRRDFGNVPRAQERGCATGGRTHGALPHRRGGSGQSPARGCRRRCAPKYV